MFVVLCRVNMNLLLPNNNIYIYFLQITAPTTRPVLSQGKATKFVNECGFIVFGLENAYIFVISVLNNRLGSSYFLDKSIDLRDVTCGPQAFVFLAT